MRCITLHYIPDLLSESAAAAGEVPRQVPDQEHERADGGGGEVGAVSAGDVGHHPAREQPGGGERAPVPVAGGVLGRHPPAAPARPRHRRHQQHGRPAAAGQDVQKQVGITNTLLNRAHERRQR